jgi:hypothetical protein
VTKNRRRPKSGKKEAKAQLRLNLKEARAKRAQLQDDEEVKQKQLAEMSEISRGRGEASGEQREHGDMKRAGGSYERTGNTR